MRTPAGYRRALLKISGEAMAGKSGSGFDITAISRIADQIAGALSGDREIGAVIGGGNIIRGADSAAIGVPNLIGDHMGMMSTVLNAVALKWALHKKSVSAEVFSAFEVGSFVEKFHLENVRKALDNKTVVIFAGGTGNPCFTTDSAAALRAVEINADVMIKATQAKGVFDKDPNKFDDAKFFERITTQEVLERRLGVMDAASVEILGRLQIPVIVLNLHEDGAIERALAGANIGTLVTG
jgi:uridylate kinase